MLQALKLFGEGKALTGFVLIAFFDTLLEGLDTFLERVQKLAQPLLTGFGEALLTLVEDLAGQLGKLRTQFVS